MTERLVLLQDFCLGLLKASRLWRQLADDEVRSLGVSEASAYPLLFMARLGDGLRQSVLADAIGIEGPSLVRLLDQLCEADLVERREDASDRRAKTLHLTGRGRVVASALTDRLDRMRLRVFAEASEGELRSALHLIAILEQAAGVPTPREHGS